MSKKRLLLFIAVLAINVVVLSVVAFSPGQHKVDFSSVLEIWGDLFRDVDRVGLTITAIPIEREVKIGDEALTFVSANDSDPRLSYLNDVGQVVAANVSRKRVPYRFHIVDVEEPNAFALPGGHIVVTDGMMAMVENEAELAAVLGHEVAHVDLKHSIGELQYQIALKRIAGNDLAAVAALAYRLAVFGFSELQEREADQAAVTLMSRAGYSPLEAVALYYHLAKREPPKVARLRRAKTPVGEIGRATIETFKDYFATHPDTESRMREVEGLLDRNMSLWDGKSFYVGRSNLRDLVARSKENRPAEQKKFSSASPQFLRMRGETAALAGNPKRAVTYFTKAIEAGERSFEVYMARARAHADQSNAKAAVADVDQAIRLTEMALVNRERELLELLKIGSRTQAIDLLQVMLPDHELILSAEEYRQSLLGRSIDKREVEDARRQLVARCNQLGTLQLESRQYEQAGATFARVLEIHPGNLVAVKGRALSQLRSGQQAAALASLGELVARNPGETEFLRVRSELYREAGELKRAEREYDRYFRFRNRGVPPLKDEDWADLEEFWTGFKYADYKAFAVTANEATDWYGTWGYTTTPREAALDAVKFCAEAAQRECKLYALGENVVWDQSASELEKAFAEYVRSVRQRIDEQISETDADAYVKRAQAYKLAGDLVGAIADYSKAIEIDSRIAEIYFLRGNAHHEKGDFDQAIADFDRAIEIDPTFFGAYVDRGNVYAYGNAGESYINKGDFDQAIADYSRAIEIEPNMATAYRARGGIYLYAGDLIKARADLKRAIELRPDDAYAALWLDIARRRANLASELSKSSLDMTIWPAPIVQFYLGELTREQLLDATKDPDPQKSDGRLCEVNFYAGQLDLLRGFNDQAIQQLRLAAEKCPINFIERTAALAQLRTLGLAATMPMR